VLHIDLATANREAKRGLERPLIPVQLAMMRLATSSLMHLPGLVTCILLPVSFRSIAAM
jgi:hypothetical protein